MSRAAAEHAHVGDVVIAEDGMLGRVERIIRSESRTPAYLVVAAGRLVRRRYPVVPTALVTEVDRARRRVHVRGPRARVGRLPESLPIVL